jgi:hypothetical protein
MKKVFWSLLIVIAVLSVSLPLHADPLGPNDPNFNEIGNNWATSWGTGVNTSYTDPISGMNTLVYFLKFDPTKFTTGDWLIKESSSGPVGDMVRFEILTNLDGSKTAVAFIFSDDTGGFNAATKHWADVGLPAVYQANYIVAFNDATNAETGFVYFPTSGQPGYVDLYALNGTHNANWGYGLSGSFDYPKVPEPASLLLLGLGLMGLAGIRRKFKS